MSVTVHRVENAPRITRVASGSVEVDLEGDGPFELDERQWALLQERAPQSFTTASPKPRRKPKTADDTATTDES